MSKRKDDEMMHAILGGKLNFGEGLFGAFFELLIKSIPKGSLGSLLNDLMSTTFGTDVEIFEDPLLEQCLDSLPSRKKSYYTCKFSRLKDLEPEIKRLAECSYKISLAKAFYVDGDNLNACKLVDDVISTPSELFNFENGGGRVIKRYNFKKILKFAKKISNNVLGKRNCKDFEPANVMDSIEAFLRRLNAIRRQKHFNEDSKKLYYNDPIDVLDSILSSFVDMKDIQSRLSYVDELDEEEEKEFREDAYKASEKFDKLIRLITVGNNPADSLAHKTAAMNNRYQKQRENLRDRIIAQIDENRNEMADRCRDFQIEYQRLFDAGPAGGGGGGGRNAAQEARFQFLQREKGHNDRNNFNNSSLFLTQRRMQAAFNRVNPNRNTFRLNEENLLKNLKDSEREILYARKLSKRLEPTRQ